MNENNVMQISPEPECLALGQLIEIFEHEEPNLMCKIGLGNPHSYRGLYDELAFEPTKPMTVGEILPVLKSALGAMFFGYKGGEYTMEEYTNVWLAYWGKTGETIGRILLQFILGKDVEFTNES